MSDARRKQQKRLKREQKRAEHRRQQNISPYKRIAQTTEIEACYVNSDWHEEGMASIHVVRRSPGGSLAVGSFLVDIWCAGLKDAFARLDLVRDDVDHALKRYRENCELTRIDIEQARQLVAAGIRFARQNGFKLPPHLDRWLAVLGGTPDVATADLSDFGAGGKLRWVGSLEDLQKRLIGSTPEAFLARPDVEFVTEVSDDFDAFDARDTDDEEDEEEDPFGRMLSMLDSIEPMFAAIQTNLRTRGITPHPRLLEGIKLVLAKAMHNIVGQTPIDALDSTGLGMRVVMNTLVADIGVEDGAELPTDLREAAAQARDELEVLAGAGGIRDAVEAALSEADGIQP